MTPLGHTDIGVLIRTKFITTQKYLANSSCLCDLIYESVVSM